MTIENAYQILYTISLLVLCVLIGIMLIRSVIAPGVTEKLICVNMLSTMVICCIAILSRLMQESYLLDVALIYAMISFIGVLMLSVTHIPSGKKRPRFHAGRPEEAGRARADGREPSSGAASSRSRADGRGQLHGGGRVQTERKNGEEAGRPGAGAAARRVGSAGQAIGREEEV